MHRITLQQKLILLAGLVVLSACNPASVATLTNSPVTGITGLTATTSAPLQTRLTESSTAISFSPGMTSLSPITATATLFIPSPTVISEPTPTETMTPGIPATLPESHHIVNITGHRQYFSLGCEAAAAKDWANYFGVDFNEFGFQYRLPISDNPDYGFVGDVDGPWGQVPPYAYGVYAGPIADLLNLYGVSARAYKGYTLDQLKAKIASDIPVITWVIGNVEGGLPSVYTDKEGRTTIVAAYEHVVIVTGYDEEHIRYMNNGKFFDTPTDVFLNSWRVLGNMVVVDQ